ncbi:MAG: hypothetical protein OQK81_04620 [Candidatus Bathyarchaeota archaeon]|nr:hypothetical protein [Candidatus Bathyarchaeota archaeon]
MKTLLTQEKPQISTNSEKAYIRPEEVRKNLANTGFELWEDTLKEGEGGMIRI